MKDILSWLKANAAQHAEAILIAAALIFVGRLALQEHDARLKADATVKTAQTAIDSLQKQQATVAQAAKVEVTVLQKEASSVQTPQQAMAALEVPPADMAQVVTPLDVQALPDAPGRVSVDALPLDKTLNACRQDGVNLGACTKELEFQKGITTQKDLQITALKQKPSFWHRVLSCSVRGGVGAAAGGGTGAAYGGATGARNGAMFGGVIGFGSCLVVKP